MAGRSGNRGYRFRRDASPAQHSPDDPVLGATIEALHWRLAEGATRFADAKAALRRGRTGRVMEHLFELEPLVFEAERILSASFLLAKEGTATEATIPE